MVTAVDSSSLIGLPSDLVQSHTMLPPTPALHHTPSSFTSHTVTPPSHPVTLYSQRHQLSLLDSPYFPGVPPSVCASCTKPILDQFIMRVNPDLEYHTQCLKCVECSMLLDERCTCYIKDGRTLCPTDYLRLYAAKCSKCQRHFGKSDIVMKARNRIYHMECFQCLACSRQLLPGDEFALRHEGLFCREDNEVLERSYLHQQPKVSPHSPASRHIPSKDMGEDISGLDQSLLTPPSSPSGSMDEKLSDETPSSGGGKHCKKGGGSGCGSVKDGKPTRVRTVMNEKQLHTLRTCYNANPRPDALMREQLVEMTGLSSRVIRVWFQNKRCKDKKRTIAMKQIHLLQAEKNINSMSGVPMVASSPVHHNSDRVLLDHSTYPGFLSGYGAENSLMSGAQGELERFMLNFDNLADGSVISDGLESPGSDGSFSVMSD